MTHINEIQADLKLFTSKLLTSILITGRYVKIKSGFRAFKSANDTKSVFFPWINEKVFWFGYSDSLDRFRVSHFTFHSVCINKRFMATTAWIICTSITILRPYIRCQYFMRKDDLLGKYEYKIVQICMRTDCQRSWLFLLYFFGVRACKHVCVHQYRTVKWISITIWKVFVYGWHNHQMEFVYILLFFHPQLIIPEHTVYVSARNCYDYTRLNFNRLLNK